MKKLGLVFVVLLASAVMAFASGSSQQSRSDSAQKQSAYHIGMVTGTVSQSEDDLRGAEELIRRYGKVSDGGIIQHVTYPDN
ncbi:MAG: DUF3798 domain-containing protein, partial [Treponema sp.]|nr:DUF3798 domain-containing protein [Treponema sp.]